MDPRKRLTRRKLVHEAVTSAEPVRRNGAVAASAVVVICAFAGATARVEPNPAAASELAVPAPDGRRPDATHLTQDVWHEAVVQALVGALSDRDPHVRRSAMNALRDIGDPSGIEAVRPLLDDPEPELRRVAAEVLGLREPRPNMPLPAPRPEPLSPEELARIRDALAAEDRGMRIDAANALGNALDPRIVPDLVPGLGDADAGVRRAAAYALGNIGSAGAVPGLLRAWPDPDGGVREAIVSALGAIGDPRAVPVLIEAAGDPDGDVRRQAAESLGKMRTDGTRPRVEGVPGDPAPEAGGRDAAAPPAADTGADPPAAPAAVDPAPAAQAPPPAPCAPAGREDGESRWTLADAARVLRIDPAAARRESASWAIGRLASPGPAVALPSDTGAPLPKDHHHSLIAAASDPATSVRVAAICSLGRVGDTRALEWLGLRAREGQDPAVREVARWAIDRIRARSGSGTP